MLPRPVSEPDLFSKESQRAGLVHPPSAGGKIPPPPHQSRTPTWYLGDMESGKTLRIVNSPGAFGPTRGYLVESVVRAVAEAHEKDPAAWSSKYGTVVENETFSMHPFCWCEEEECPWCGPTNAPNFHYKPSGFKLWWYKYIGRGMEMNREVTSAECAEMLSRCLPPPQQAITSTPSSDPPP